MGSAPARTEQHTSSAVPANSGTDIPSVGGTAWPTPWTNVPSHSAPEHVRTLRPVPREMGSGATVERVWLQAASLRPGCPIVAVSSADGGVGRSTLVAGLGGLLALACPAPVLAIDATGRAWGGLSHRVGRQRPGSVWDGVVHLPMLTSRAWVEQWTQCGPTGLLALLGEAEMTVERRPPVTAETEPVVEALRGLYPLILLDLPPADVGGAWRALAYATAPVLVARATTDSLQHTLRMLTQFRAVGMGAVADTAVLVAMATSPVASPEVKAVQRQAAGEVGDLLTVPFDPDLARPAPVDPRRVHRLTRRALLEIAAAVLARCAVDPGAGASVDADATRPTSGKEQG